jgi:preprotein translocase subunit SecD
MVLEDEVVVRLYGDFDVADGEQIAAVLAGENTFELRPVLQTAPFLPVDEVDAEGVQDPDSCLLLGGTTDSAHVTADATVVLPARGADSEEAASSECFELGPVPAAGGIVLDGSTVSDPSAQLASGQWIVALTVDYEHLELFNSVTERCFGAEPTCPTRRLAVVLDGLVQSAPSINEPSFPDGEISISGSFTEAEAHELTLALRLGALGLPIDLVSVVPLG